MKTLREAKGLRREDLASLAGISHAYIYKLESGAATPGLEIARRVAEVLGVTVDEAFPPEAAGDLVSPSSEPA